MTSEFPTVFARLHQILESHAPGFSVSRASPRLYELEASVGPATLRAWGGKAKRPRTDAGFIA